MSGRPLRVAKYMLSVAALTWSLYEAAAWVTWRRLSNHLRGMANG